jgi:hypothetical protein
MRTNGALKGLRIGCLEMCQLLSMFALLDSGYGG